MFLLYLDISLIACLKRSQEKTSLTICLVFYQYLIGTIARDNHLQTKTSSNYWLDSEAFQQCRQILHYKIHSIKWIKFPICTWIRLSKSNDLGHQPFMIFISLLYCSFQYVTTTIWLITIKCLWIGEKLCDLYPLTLNAISRRIPIKLPVFLFWMTILFTRGLNRICPQIDGILLVWSTNSAGWSFAHIFLLKIKPADPVIDNFSTVFRKKESHLIIQALTRNNHWEISIHKDIIWEGD